MKSKLTTLYESKAVRHYGIVVAFAVVIFALVFLGTETHTTDISKSGTEQTPPLSVTSSTATDAYTLPASEPTRLRIPAINVDTTFEEPLGVNRDRSIEVPDSFEKVGYYKYGPAPGALGPAVVLGHVDSHDGPAVFFPLGQLDPGDEIYIDRADGTTATFTVTRLERHEQSGFPTEKVYGNIGHAGLRLITCSGTYQRGEERYTHNLIVFARLKDPEGEESE